MVTDRPPPVAPQGWYETPEHGQRYWDGSRWLVPASATDVVPSTAVLRLPLDPPSAPSTPSIDSLTIHLQKTGRRRWRWIVAGAIVLAIAAGFLVSLKIHTDVITAQAVAKHEVVQAEQERVAAAEKQAADAAKKAADAAQLQRERDDAATVVALQHMKDMKALGWSPMSPELFYSFVDPKKITCGDFPCAYVIVLTEVGCPGGLYVEASILAGQLSVGFANGVTAALPAEGQAQLRLDDLYGGGHMYQITDIHCRA